MIIRTIGFVVLFYLGLAGLSFFTRNPHGDMPWGDAFILEIFFFLPLVLFAAIVAAFDISGRPPPDLHIKLLLIYALLIVVIGLLWESFGPVLPWPLWYLFALICFVCVRLIADWRRTRPWRYMK